MFDIGFFELVVIGVVGLLVLGPERLPHAIRMGGAYLGKIRRTVTSVREEFEREVNIKEMQERVKKQLDESGLKDVENSLKEVQAQIEIEPNPKANLNKKPEETPQPAADNTIAGGMVAASSNSNNSNSASTDEPTKS